MTSLFNDICEWATAELAYWEQLALDKIIAGETLTRSNYEQLVQLLLEDKGLAEKSTPRPDLGFLRHLNLTASAPAHAVRLLEISRLENINALAPEQSVAFSDQITLIYGANGSGKSGYARVLGCACFSRGDRDVLPDIAQPPMSNARRSARIVVTDGTVPRTIDFAIGDSCPELARFHAFDSASVKVHLTDQNAISFSPPGLSYLTALVAETDKCRDFLLEKTRSRRQPQSFGLLFPGDTQVGRVIAGLNEKTDTKELQKLAQLTVEEESKISELEAQIATIKSENIGEKLAQLDTEIEDLGNLITQLQTIEECLSDPAIDEMNARIAQCRLLQDEVSKTGVEQFHSERFTQIGSSLWHQFIKAAKAFADTENSEQTSYPHAEDQCLLCRQSLNCEASDLIKRLWAYLENEAQTKLEVSNSELAEMSGSIMALQLDGFNDQLVTYRHLAQYDSALLDVIIKFFRSADQRRASIQQAANDLIDCAPPLLAESGIGNINAVVQRLQTQRTELAARERKEELVNLEKELLELRHRTLLRDQLPAISEYIAGQQWAAKAEKARGNTSHITKKQNELFERRVTERYKELFEQLLKAMGRPLKVRVQTKGKKGETFKQIVLETEEKSAKPDKVLSEGEKRAVAMADFLTEVTLNEASGGIILDDPVTSLDSDWKDVVAQRLVDEARRRQVIIFTHDLQFMHLINRHAEDKKLTLRSHRVFRGIADDRPGFIELDHSPILEKSYRDPTLAERYCQMAERADLPAQEPILRSGFGALRSSYEAFVAHDLLGDVVRRFEPNVSVGRLRGVRIDQNIVEEVIAKYGLLSRFIEGHLPADGFPLQDLTPVLLRKEIEDFRELKRKLSKLKKK